VKFLETLFGKHLAIEPQLFCAGKCLCCILSLARRNICKEEQKHVKEKSRLAVLFLSLYIYLSVSLSPAFVCSLASSRSLFSIALALAHFCLLARTYACSLSFLAHMRICRLSLLACSHVHTRALTSHISHIHITHPYVLSSLHIYITYTAITHTAF